MERGGGGRRRGRGGSCGRWAGNPSAGRTQDFRSESEMRGEVPDYILVGDG